MHVLCTGSPFARNWGPCVALWENMERKHAVLDHVQRAASDCSIYLLLFFDVLRALLEDAVILFTDTLS